MPQQPGVIALTSLVGTESVIVDNGGAVFTKATVQQIANLGASGGTTTATLIGTEFMPVQTAGGTQEKITAANFNVWAVASGTVTTVPVGTEIIPIQTAGGVAQKASFTTMVSNQPSFTTSAQSNSTSVTLSTVFTALTYTQTSTGNTVHLKLAPVNHEIQGFSVTNIVTNLTVSAAANTVSGGAIGTTVVGNTFWWIFDLASTTWYRYNGR